MTFGNDRKELRKGEKLTVTIDEVLHNTILVILEYRKAKFCGALLNTTNRRGPYGIEEQPDLAYYRAYDIDPKKVKSKNDEEISEKNTATVHFPQMLDVRTTYGQKIKQPPPREIYMRRRRSKRKVRMDMMDTDLAVQLATAGSGRKMLSHSAHCCCDKCASGFVQLSTTKKPIQEKKKFSEMKKPLKGKRKLVLDLKNGDQTKPEKNEDKKPTTVNRKNLETVKAKPNSKEPKRMKLDEKAIEKKNPTRNKADSTSLPIKRSPIIKISYKSPGGKGRVLKIPSRLHSPPLLAKSDDKTIGKIAMHERARKVVNRAKSEHFKYLKEHTIDDMKSKSQSSEDESITVEKLKKILLKNPASLGITVDHNAKRISLSPQNLSHHDPKWHSIQNLLHAEKEKKISPRKKTDKVVSNGEGTMDSQARPLTRNLHPTVILQPLSSEKATAAASALDKSKASSHNNTKSKLKVQSEASEAEEMQASTSAIMGATTVNKKRPSTGGSHSISVTRCKTKEGVQWCQGDVVWGKVLGFPWWPGILQKIIIKKAENSLEQIAVVDWFQSKTVSHIPCTALESFSASFKKRFVRKLKGKYKKAIQDAREAEKDMSKEVRKLIMQFET